jgi:hypothetical protein
MVNKSIVYYTDNQVDEAIGKKCRELILKSNLPIISVSLKPLDFGTNIVLNLERGYVTYYRQILTGLEASTAEFIFFCEHDWLYHPSHFEFTPPRQDIFYYNDNWWRVRASDGHALYYRTHLASVICAYRGILLENYRTILSNIEKNGFSHSYIRGMGFEPGTHHRKERPTNYKAEGWKSTYPNIDIRHTTNLTQSRWKQSNFRSPENCRNWQEKKAWEIEGWDFWTKNTISKFDITNCQSI